MSKKSVGTKSVIPQISKAHGRMIIVGHNLEKIDSTMLDETWCRAIFFKHSKKHATIVSQLLPKPFDIVNIPPTKIEFDPYVLAPFTEKPENNTVFFKEKDKQTLYDWSHGKTPKELGLSNQQISRIVKPFVARMLENECNM